MPRASTEPSSGMPESRPAAPEGTSVFWRFSGSLFEVNSNFSSPAGPVIEAVTTPPRGTDPAAISMRVDDPTRVAAALHRVGEQGLVITEYSLGQPSLDEVFLALTGRPAEDSQDTGEDAA